MLIVCDGGSTKADWKILADNGSVISRTTHGFNPNYNAIEAVEALLKREFGSLLASDQKGTLYYYGAGCSDEKRCNAVAAALATFFRSFQIEVNTDMLGAARATCGKNPGIACILGTGSNSMLYDGCGQSDQVANLGFLLGDEGSGAQIGKRIIQSYFYREMPQELVPLMQTACPGGREEMLDKVYKSGGVPAAYLATFASLFASQTDHPFIRNIFRENFLEFLKRHVLKYEKHQEMPVNFAGSIAFYHQEILVEALLSLKLRPGQIVQKPIAGLFGYHLSFLSEQ
ncbi:MAG: hypothetical protein RI973_234 [Bacteroidota bacterium]|jgi:N-acetylglucosamine kinase-like BadF-type ATPase